MAAETGKLYLVADHSSVTNERPVILELKGTVDLMIYGSNEEVSTLVNVTDLTPCLLENLTDDLVSALSGMPRYIAFIGTADRIIVQDKDLTYVKDIS
jgi:hypothetical protein